MLPVQCAAINGAPLRAYFMLERGKSSGSEKRREEIRRAKEAKAKADAAKAGDGEDEEPLYLGYGFFMDVIAFLRDVAAFFISLGKTVFICQKRGEEEEDDGQVSGALSRLICFLTPLHPTGFAPGNREHVSR